MDYRKNKKQLAKRALRRQGSTHGFSMAETLATVAIIVILLALAVVGIFNLYYSLQQKELDSKAEIIYVAAQDQMTKIMAAGQKALMDPKTSTSEATLIAGVPADAKDEELAEETDDPNTNYIKRGSLAFLTSKQLRTDAQGSSLNAASLLFGDGGLDDELLDENWIIEYDVSSLTVYAVFFNPDNSDFVDGYVDEANSGGNGGYNGYRAYNDRLRSLKSHSKTIGYHGGAGSAASSDSHNLSLSVNIVNKEKLVANIVCDKPAALADDIVFRVDVKDIQDNTFRAYYTINDALTGQSNGYKVVHTPAVSSDETDALYKSGYRYSLKLTLDSLESGSSKRFRELYGSGHTEATGAMEFNQKLIEGSDVTVTVAAFCPTNNTVQSISDSATSNSLFANVEGDTAHIAYGRHLQNLDSDSGVGNSNIAKAVQDRDIDFTQAENNTADEYEDWFNTYGSPVASDRYYNKNDVGIPLFKPIENGKLTSYDGQSKEIKHLYVKTTGAATSSSAALFDSLSSGKELLLQNINLVSPLAMSGAAADPKGNVGALVGQSDGSLSISNCQVYLLEEDRKADSQANSWMQGLKVGGLVGYVKSGNVSVVGSSASTVIGDTSASGPSSQTTVGGLIGTVDNGGSVVIENSYSDSYLMGSTVGGLVGVASSSDASIIPAAIINSYAAGFLAWGNRGAGILANGAGNSIFKTYSVMDILSEDKAAGYKSPGSLVPIAPNGSATLSECFYLQDVSGEIGQSAAGAIGVSDNNDGHAKITSSLIDNNAGTPFVVNAGSEPYNLMSQGLSPDSYEWPKINKLKHYGDWAAGFKAGSLVYYEKYRYEKYQGKKQEYGFDGANVTKTLLDSAKDDENKRLSVVGDGYGIVYKKGQKPSANITVAVTRPDGATVDTYNLADTADPYIVNNEYEIYPLPASITNAEKGKDGFFFKATISVEGGGTAMFFFNPHFARTVRGPVNPDASTPELGNTAYLRSARQLYNLSSFYKDYRDVSKGRVFSQERNIDYDEYEWTDDNFAGLDNKVTAQEPIGVSSQESFQASYDGNHHEITNVSFETQNEKTCAGLFGSVAAGSTVQNVVLCTDYDPSEQNKNKKFYVKCAGTLSGNVNAYLGVLAGYNAGTISNCAVSGYYIADSTGTIHAYTNSRVHVGGLVGANKGTIIDCSADSPRLRLSALFSDVNAAGFVGTNLSGAKVQNSYALGAVELTDAKGGKVNIAGFAGKNEGRITSSYTATALSVSGEGAQSYGFAPVGGYVSSNCRYLNGGTYSYLQKMYSYNFRTALSAGKPITYDELKGTSADGNVDAGHTFYYYNTDTTLKAYPYRGVVKDASGDYVHYGDWQDDVRLGTLGVFYWEHEEHGSNDGYHMTYLGTKAEYDSDKKLKDTLEQGSSLCTAHDDGGVITSYGYGFYVQNGENVTATWDGVDCSSGNGIDTSLIANYNRSVSKNLQDQLTDTGVVDDNYAFYAFTTRTESQANGGDYIALNRNSMNGTSINKDAQNGYLTLGLNSKSDEATNAVRSYKFELSPFFANALSIHSVDGSEKADLVSAANTSPLEASDGMLNDYSKQPGKSETTVAGGKQTAGNAYEIRSLDQLQYINWNSDSKSTDKLSTADNYQNFNYLMYPDQTKASSSKIGSIDKVASESKERASLFWTQTHDVAPANTSSNFTPIAGTYESSSGKNNNNGGYNAAVYLWFGGAYNGQSYTVKNINIKSNSFNVGLFGTTVGANIRNVIMYSDDASEHTITRVQQPGSEYPDKEGAYSLGGLIGVAFDYVVDANSLKNSSNAIENCAISGYSIIDESSNQMALGEVNVGGLIGVANVNLRQCSANTEILERSTFKNGVAQFGAFIRVGGLCGGAQGNVVDCYSGGSFDFPEDIAADVTWDDRKTDSGNRDFFIGVGGIAGSAFTTNYVNLTGQNTVRDGSPKFVSCYTYFNFPDHGFSGYNGKVPRLVMSTIASRADRGGISNGKLEIVNCYYYDQIPVEDKDYPGTGKVSIQYRGGNAGQTSGTPQSVSYNDMSSTGANSFVDKLNSGNDSSKTWDWVTTEDAGGAIDGKFSFPAGNSALEGKNYPFPTIVTQNDLTFGTVSEPSTVHVHYGDWPLANASYWKQGRGTIDIFADRLSATSLARKTFELHVNSSDFSGALSAESFEFSDDGIVKVANDGIAGGTDGVYKVKLEALQEGSTTVTLKNTSAKISLQVTADLDLSATLDAGSPGELRENPYTLVLDTGSDNAAKLTLAAASGTVDCNSMIDSWSWTNDPDGQTVVAPSFETDTWHMTVTRSGSGTVLLAIDANYTYDGQKYTKQLYLNVTEPGVLGLSNGTTFNEARNNGRGAPGVDNSYVGADSRPSYTLSSDESFYLYSASDDLYFDDASHVASVTILSGTKESECKPGEYKQGSDYCVTLADKAVVFGAFKYLPAKIAYLGNEKSKPNKVTVVVKLSNGSTLQCVLAGDALKTTETSVLTFRSGEGAGAQTKDLQFPNGYKYKFEGYADIFGSGGDAFDEWQKGPDDFFSKGDTLTVNSNATFVATYKKTLTLSLKNGDPTLTQSVLVGRKGIENVGKMSNDTAKSLFDQYRLDGWYDGTGTSAKKVADAGGSLADDGSYANGAVKIDGNVLTMSADATLYAAKATWTPAATIEDGQDYLITNSNTKNRNAEIKLAASDGANEDNEIATSEFASEAVPLASIYKLAPSSVATDSSSASKISARVEDNAVWHAVAQPTYSGNNGYFAFLNYGSNLYLIDAGAKQTSSSWWYIGGINSIDNSGGLTISGVSYDNWRRCSFIFDAANKTLKTFNKPGSNKNVRFSSANGAVLFAEVGGDSNTYLYAKNLEFNWK